MEVTFGERERERARVGFARKDVKGCNTCNLMKSVFELEEV